MMKTQHKELNIHAIKLNGEKHYVSNYGFVNAGFPSPAEDFIDDKISLDERYLTHPESTFLIVVGGDSMHPYYQKNDVLIIRTDLTPLHNDDIIVSVNKTDYTLKRFDKLNNKLVALNPKYNDCVQIKEDDDVLILGVVAVLVREKCNRI
ncbi:S24 family peptidase [Algoriella sp.]|uniref:LexA family protein n=1 Tax=Algoriella sp. TaxID=1872434 RepID=UPI001B173CDE|nr:S24 family peptidase [Algoriella sp.]MBO6212303.1 DNA repair protein [Algoriella sp.]